jgi:N,N'-diacetylchitobiose transport system substrate-binding protein
MVLKRKKLVALACAGASVALVASACSSSKSNGSTGSGGSSAAPATITVWLMTDSQTGWDKAVNNATAQFKQQHPGSNVNVQFQTWGTYLTKFSSAVKAGSVPDVMEVGNTQAGTPASQGAFADLSSVKGNFPNSANWNAGLVSSCTQDGKLYCVPYYAADRMAGINPTQAAAVGITAPPTSWQDLLTDISKLNGKYGDVKGYTGFEVPGQYEYLGLAFIADAGGQAAVDSNGKWQGTLESAASEKGLANYCTLFQASKNNDPTALDANQDTAWSNGTTGILYGLGWEYDNPPKGFTGTSPTPAFYFNIPSPTKAGSSLPDFTGGSDLAVPAGSKNQSLAEAWIADYTSSANEAIMVQAGDIPNATNLMSDVTGAKNTQYASGQQNPFFVPEAPKWTNVDGGTPNIIDTMLENITKGGCTASAIDTNAKSADQQIDSALN